jgi:hypothetical protein
MRETVTAGQWDQMCGRETSASQHSLQKQASYVWHTVGSPLLPVCSRRVKLTIMDDTYSHGGKTNRVLRDLRFSQRYRWTYQNTLSQDMIYQTCKTSNRRRNVNEFVLTDEWRADFVVNSRNYIVFTEEGTIIQAYWNYQQPFYTL